MGEANFETLEAKAYSVAELAKGVTERNRVGEQVVRSLGLLADDKGVSIGEELALMAGAPPVGDRELMLELLVSGLEMGDSLLGKKASREELRAAASLALDQ